MTADSPNLSLSAALKAQPSTPYYFLILCVFISYINVFDNQFLFDDDLIIVLNTWIKDWSHIGDILTGSTTNGAHIIGGFYRPLQLLLYLLMHHLGGGGTFWFHALNLSLHIANTCLVYKLGKKLGFYEEACFLAALVWGVHPIHTEAVTYMSATADTLHTLFCLGSIVVLLPTFSARKVWLAVPLLLLGILSKETMVILPALATVTLFCISPKRFDPRIYLPTWPLWLISLGYVHWRSNNPNFDGPLTYKRIYAMPQYEELRLYAETFSYRIYTFFSTLPDYLELLLWPHGLHMDRFFPVAKTLFAAPVLGGMLMVALGAGYVVWSYWNKPREKHAGKAASPKLLDDRRALSWGLLWFAAAHAPDSGLLFSINSMFLEHWMYLPTTGLFLGLAQTLTGTLRKCPPVAVKTVAASVLLFAAVLSAKTIAQNAIWQNPDTFYNNIFNNGDESARTRNNLALYYSKMGRNDEAIQQFLRSIALSDTYAESRFNLALLYLNNPKIPNNVDLAIENLKRSIEIQPTFYRSYKTLGEIYKIVLHDEEKAKIFMDKASELYQLRQ